MEQAYWFLGIHVTVLAEGSTTKGHYDLLSYTSLPGIATPWGQHTTYDVHLLVLEGELAVHTDTHNVVLTAGQSWLIQRKTANSINNSGQDRARSLAIASPSGLMQLVRSMGVYAEAGSLPPTSKPNPVVLAQALAQAGSELLVPLATVAEPSEQNELRVVDHYDYSTTSYLRELMQDFA